MLRIWFHVLLPDAVWHGYSRWHSSCKWRVACSILEQFLFVLFLGGVHSLEHLFLNGFFLEFADQLLLLNCVIRFFFAKHILCLWQTRELLLEFFLVFRVELDPVIVQPFSLVLLAPTVLLGLLAEMLLIARSELLFTNVSVLLPFSFFWLQ